MTQDKLARLEGRPATAGAPVARMFDIPQIPMARRASSERRGHEAFAMTWITLALLAALSLGAPRWRRVMRGARSLYTRPRRFQEARGGTDSGA
jgi:hypothetical protein